MARRLFWDVGRRSARVLAVVLATVLWGTMGNAPLWAAAQRAPAVQEQDLVTYRVTIENLTTGQPFSLPLVTTHSGDVRLFHVNQVATDELAALAQAGDPAPLLSLLQGLDGVTDAVTAPTPVTPAGIVADINGNEVISATTVTITAAPGDYLSLATMLICTNDGFTGLDSALLPADETPLRIELNAYDAGREENTESSEDLVDACSALGPVALFGDPNRNVDDGDALTDPPQPILLHRNVRDGGDLDPQVHGWENPVALITIVREDGTGDADEEPETEAEEPTEEEPAETPVTPSETLTETATLTDTGAMTDTAALAEPDALTDTTAVTATTPITLRIYDVAFQNPTIGQPFSPPIIVSHSPDVHLFQEGELASDALAALAQDGDPQPVVDLLVEMDGVTEVVNLGQPLLAAGAITETDGTGILNTALFTITAAPGDVLSLATMLVCTNDGFVGLDAAPLPESGQQIYTLNAYDAGREENTEESADLVDACATLGPLPLVSGDAEDEDGSEDGNINDGDVATDPPQPIERHPGVTGTGDLDATVHGWLEPVMALVVTRQEEAPDPGLVTLQSSNEFTETVDALQEALETAGLNVVAVVDHAANAASADQELLPTTLILAGNPNIGTPLMQSSRTIAIDLPQKFLVWQSEDGTVFITYNDPYYLASRHGITGQNELLEQVATALSNFASTAANGE